MIIFMTLLILVAVGVIIFMKHITIKDEHREITKISNFDEFVNDEFVEIKEKEETKEKKLKKGNEKTIAKEMKRETREDEKLYPNPRSILESEEEIKKDLTPEDFDIEKDLNVCNMADIEAQIQESQEIENIAMCDLYNAMNEAEQINCFTS